MAMDAHPDEEARINNGSLSDRDKQPEKSSHTFKSGFQASKSHQSHSTFLNNQFLKPGTSVGNRRTVKESTLRSPCDPHDLMMTRGTFSRAGKPRVKPDENTFDVMSRRSLYDKVIQQNMDANRSLNLSAKAKDAVHYSFKSAQKTF